MKTFVLSIIFSFVFLTQIFAECSTGDLYKINKDLATWKTYRNSKYGYEIRYPERLEILVTGAEIERDGRGFLIVYGDVAKLHGLQVKLYIDKTLDQIVQERDLQEFGELNGYPVEKKYGQCLYKSSKVKINGKEIIKREYCKKKDPLWGITFVLDGIALDFLSTFEDFDETVAEEIASSFRFYKK